ncbi:unnamed protein product [Allacma fusca]|uniref:Uncharacterized protein n=1 Tax=Allacma fusca TaxID=39272 RepID=A0A8J2L5R6_9HEXA|nr:unnamed protein product [Allacma fusca]
MKEGKCFAVAGVTDVDTLDNKKRETFLPLPIETLWKKNVPSYHWIWRQSWNPLKLGKECCSSQIISTHQNSPQEMEKMFEVLYSKKDKSKIDKGKLKGL